MALTPSIFVVETSFNSELNSPHFEFKILRWHERLGGLPTQVKGIFHALYPKGVENRYLKENDASSFAFSFPLLCSEATHHLITN